MERDAVESEQEIWEKRVESCPKSVQAQVIQWVFKFVRSAIKSQRPMEVTLGHFHDHI